MLVTDGINNFASADKGYHHTPVLAGLLTGAAVATDVLVLDTDELELAAVTAVYNACKQHSTTLCMQLCSSSATVHAACRR